MADNQASKGRLIKTTANRRPAPQAPRTGVNKERLKKTIFKPWPAARIFKAEHHELVDREWELTRIVNAVNAELTLVRQRLKKEEHPTFHGVFLDQS